MNNNDPSPQPRKSNVDEPAFRQLVRVKRRSAWPALGVGVGFYLAVSLLAGYAPSLLSTPVLGPINLGFVLILFTYVLTWVIAVLYVRRANRTFDRLAEAARGAASKEIQA